MNHEYFQYYFEHFPAEHFSLLYLLNTIFCGFANYTTNPIFSLWIVDGDNTGEYNFKEGEFFNANPFPGQNSNLHLPPNLTLKIA